jgi:hypothetical protein
VKVQIVGPVCPTQEIFVTGGETFPTATQIIQTESIDIDISAPCSSATEGNQSATVGVTIGASVSIVASYTVELKCDKCSPTPAQ